MMPTAFLHAPATIQTERNSSLYILRIVKLLIEIVCILHLLFPTSFCVTVSMMVPKAGIVDILTELKSAGEQDNGFTIHSH